MDFISFQEGNTAIHLAAKHGHTQVLDALKGHVTWDITSTKVYYSDKINCARTTKNDSTDSQSDLLLW